MSAIRAHATLCLVFVLALSVGAQRKRSAMSVHGSSGQIEDVKLVGSAEEERSEPRALEATSSELEQRWPYGRRPDDSWKRPARHARRPHRRVLAALAPDKALEPSAQDSDWKLKRGKRGGRQRGWNAVSESDYNHQQDSSLITNPAMYEAEVSDVQQSSVGSYTIEPIKKEGMLSELVHIKCNRAGSGCKEIGTYCCIQTFRWTEVHYVGGRKDRMKVYNGCVCALQKFKKSYSRDSGALPLDY